MNKTTSYLSRIAVISGLALGAFTLSALADWHVPGYPGAAIAPTSCPPDRDGCNAPINVGAGGQAKVGSLSLFSTLVSGSFAQYGLLVQNSPIKAAGGLIIENRTSDPASPENGAIWIVN